MPPSLVDRSFGRAFFVQAENELQDAEVLFANDRWSGTVRSAQGAVEKALKAALYMSLGYGSVPLTHYVERFVTTKRLGSRLRKRIRLLEGQVPTKADNRNPEYPYGDPPLSPHPVTPATSYSRREAEYAVETARRTVKRIRALYRALR